MFEKKRKYNNLYLDILELGQGKVEEGLSFNELKKKLSEKGYDFENDCIELAVKQWFYDSFHHISADKEVKNAHDVDNHLDCNFILKGESCLKLISYKTSRFSFRNGLIAISISFLVMTYTIIRNVIQDTKKEESKQLIENVIQIKESINEIKENSKKQESKQLIENDIKTKKSVGEIKENAKKGKGTAGNSRLAH